MQRTGRIRNDLQHAATSGFVSTSSGRAGYAGVIELQP